MLAQSHVSGCFLVLCDECRLPVTTEVAATTREDARRELASRGWLECAVKGKGRERWRWRCPACNPELRPPSRTMGRST